MNPDVVSVAIRAGSFVALLQAGGVVLFLMMFGRQLSASQGMLRRLGGSAALVALVLVSLHYALEAARMGGAWVSAFDGSLQELVWQTSTRDAWAARVLGLVLIAVGVHRSSVAFAVMGVAGALLLAISFALMGHTTESAVRWLSLLLSAHIAAVIFWFGSLLPLHIAARIESVMTTAALLAAFSRYAVWVVAVLLVAGLALWYWLTPEGATPWTPYGWLVIAKLTSFSVLMILAALNKWRYTPRLMAGEATALPGLRRAVLAEYLLICGVLVITAVLTTFFSPE